METIQFTYANFRYLMFERGGSTIYWIEALVILLVIYFRRSIGFSIKKFILLQKRII